MMNLTSNWWILVLRGVSAVLFGLAAFLWPGLTWLTLVVLFGVYALVDGFIAVVAGIKHTRDSSRWWIFLLEGLVGIGAGVSALVWPGLTAYALMLVIAAWAVVTGVLEITAAIRLRREIDNEWLLALSGLLSVALGALLFIQPAAGGLAMIWVIGAYALIFGILLISLGFRLRAMNLPLKRRTKSSLRQSHLTR